MTDALIVDDLMLLLLDDDGATIRTAGTLHYTLGGALLAELALRERIALDETRPGWVNGAMVTSVGEAELDDPLLQSAFDTVAEKPQRVQPLLLTLGAGLWKTVLERLEQRGLVAREQKRFLGFFKTTSWPTRDAAHEAELRAEILAALEGGAIPSDRTAIVIGLIHASGAMPALDPPLPWNSTIATRAQAFQDGEWGAAAVGSAISRSVVQAAVAAAAAAISVAVVVSP